jgi:pimeloyl-ACP methyl ester carboxylesterase
MRYVSQDRLVASIPGSRLVIYEGGGHAFDWEAFLESIVGLSRRSYPR